MINLHPEHRDPNQNGPRICRGPTNKREINPKEHQKWVNNIIGQEGILHRDNREFAVFVAIRPSDLLNESEIKEQDQADPIVVAEWSASSYYVKRALLNGNHRSKFLYDDNEELLEERTKLAHVIEGLTRLNEGLTEGLDDDQQQTLKKALVAIGNVSKDLGQDTLFPAKLYDLGE